jgi:hypothetical protein
MKSMNTFCRKRTQFVMLHLMLQSNLKRQKLLYAILKTIKVLQLCEEPFIIINLMC